MQQGDAEYFAASINRHLKPLRGEARGGELLVWEGPEILCRTEDASEANRIFCRLFTGLRDRLLGESDH